MDDQSQPINNIKDYVDELLRCEPPRPRRYAKVSPEPTELTLKQRKKILADKKKKKK
jgi:hypothetical protein